MGMPFSHRLITRLNWRIGNVTVELLETRSNLDRIPESHMSQGEFAGVHNASKSPGWWKGSETKWEQQDTWFGSPRPQEGFREWWQLLWSHPPLSGERGPGAWWWRSGLWRGVIFCTWEYERSPFVQKNLFLVEQTWNQKAPKKGGNMYWAVLVSRLTDEYTLLIYLDHMIWYTMTCLATLIWYTMIKYVRDGVDVVVLYQLLQYWSAYVQVPAKDSNIYQLAFDNVSCGYLGYLKYIGYSSLIKVYFSSTAQLLSTLVWVVNLDVQHYTRFEQKVINLERSINQSANLAFKL